MPSTKETVPQAMLGRASASFVAGVMNVRRFEKIFFIASSVPKRSFVEPMLIAYVDGNVLEVAWVFCRATNAGNRKIAVIPIASNEKSAVFASFVKKLLKPSHLTMLYAMKIRRTKIQVNKPM